MNSIKFEIKYVLHFDSLIQLFYLDERQKRSFLEMRKTIDIKPINLLLKKISEDIIDTLWNVFEEMVKILLHISFCREKKLKNYDYDVN